MASRGIAGYRGAANFHPIGSAAVAAGPRESRLPACPMAPRAAPADGRCASGTAAPQSVSAGWEAAPGAGAEAGAGAQG